MDTYSHACIKPGCSNKYSDSDPDAYLCPSCVEEKNFVAAELDRKHPTVGQKPSGALAAFDAAPRIGGRFVQM